MFRNCNSPTISYGVIVARKDKGSATTRYLLIQRQDSLSYIDFVRGKYHPQNLAYLQQLFKHMTNDERALVANPATDFAALWSAVWHRPVGSHQGHEYNEARANFEALRAGYALRVSASAQPGTGAMSTSSSIGACACACVGTGTSIDGASCSSPPHSTDGTTIIPVSLASLVATTASLYPLEREWGFPKGRRKLKESDSAAAVREFSEETLYSPSDIELLTGIKPIEETFQGTNGVRYRHVYFVARMREQVADPTSLADARNVREQAREVREVKWCSRQEVLERLRPYNVERRHLFNRVADLLEN